MTRDEIRGLIGGYATGSLSAAERKTLFEAALDDQELFDALAAEQALKQLLDEPDVKVRLAVTLAARQTERRQNAWLKPAWLKKPWVWAGAGAVAAGVFIGFEVLKAPPPQELAQVTAPARPLPAPSVTLPVLPEPEAPPQVIVPKQAAPAIPAPPPIAAPSAVPSPKIPAPARPVVVAQAPKLGSGPAPVVPPLVAPAAQAAGTLSGVVGGVPAGIGGVGDAGGGGGGGRGGAANRAMALRVPAAVAPARFAFDYSVTPEGSLRIVAAANGFLSVSVNNGSATSVLFSGRLLQAGSVTVIPLPPDSVSALATFSVRAVAPEVLGATSALDPPSGTKSDPNPTADSVLEVLVSVRR